MCVYSRRTPNCSAAVSSARNPSGITSRPMPSPGITAILNGAVVLVISGDRGANVFLIEHIVQSALQTLEQQIHIARFVAQGRGEPENIVCEGSENNAVSVGDPGDTLTQAQRGIETALGCLVGHQ